MKNLFASYHIPYHWILLHRAKGSKCNQFTGLLSFGNLFLKYIPLPFDKFFQMLFILSLASIIDF